MSIPVYSTDGKSCQMITDWGLQDDIYEALKEHCGIKSPRYRIVAWDAFASAPLRDTKDETGKRRPLPVFFYTSHQESSRFGVYVIKAPDDIQQIISFSNLESAKKCKEHLESIDWDAAQ